MQRLVFAIIAIALAYNLALSLDCCSRDIAGLHEGLTNSLLHSWTHADYAAPASHFIAPGGDDDLACEDSYISGENSSTTLAEPQVNPTAIAPGGDDDLPLNL